jgi:hypothetical protein
MLSKLHEKPNYYLYEMNAIPKIECFRIMFWLIILLKCVFFNQSMIWIHSIFQIAFILL